MKLIVIIGIVLGLAAGLVAFLVEIGSERVVDRVFGRLRLQSGKGPLEATAASDGETIVVTVRNKGTHKVRLAAIEGRDGRRKRIFPTPRFEQHHGAATAEAHKQLARVILDATGSATVMLDRSELIDMACRTLAVLDSNGRSWPVAGFDPTTPE